MSSIKGQEYGSFISDDLAHLIKETTTRKDWRRIGESLSVPFKTIQNVMYLQVPLSENNERAVKALLRLALRRAKKLPSEIEQYLT